jgi:hypothetical protein
MTERPAILLKLIPIRLDKSTVQMELLLEVDASHGFAFDVPKGGPRSSAARVGRKVMRDGTTRHVAARANLRFEPA